MAKNATDLREYPRGQAPGDWSPLYGSESFLVRSVDGDPHRSSWIEITGAAAREVLRWEPADGETGRANQEVLALLSLPAHSDLGVLALRASGASGASANAYVLRLDAPGDLIKIERYAAGTAALLASAPCAGLLGFVSWWVRFRANGTSLQAKAWPEGSSEPAGWTVSATDATHADGSLGLYRGSSGIGPELYFLAYGTNGDTAPGADSIPPGMATWALDPDAQIELTVEMESLAPDSGVEASYLFSTRGRFTDARDFPPSVEMPPLLQDPGSLAIRLAEDLLFGQAEGSLGRVQLRNPRNILNFLMDLTLAGRRLTVRAGLASWPTHRWFEPVYSSLMEGEPAVEETVDVALQAPYRLIEQNLLGRRMVGIPTCLQLSNAAIHQATYVAAYDLRRLLITFRFLASSAPASSPGVYKRLTGAANNFSLFLEAGTGAVIGSASIAGINDAIYLRSPLTYADGRVHLGALGIDADQLAYLIVDGEPVAQITPPGLVDLPATGVRLLNFMGERIFDVRLYDYCPEIPEAQALLATRANGDDPGMVGMWPCDDGLGGIATDYSATANPITLAGTVNVDYAWQPTDQGEGDLAGSQIQIAAGAVYNAPALLIDANRQRFRLSDGTLPGGLTVRSKGAVTATWTDGGDGVIQFPTVTAEPVTFDHGPSDLGFDGHLSFPYVVETLMRDRMGLTEASYDPIATAALIALMPFQASFFASGEMTGAAALEAMLGGAAGHYRQDRDGRIVPGMILPPITPGPVAGEAVLEFLGTAGRSRVSWASARGGLPAGSFTIAFWVKSFALDRFTQAGDALLPFPCYQTIAKNTLTATLGGFHIGFHRQIQGGIGFEIPSLDPGGMLAFSPTGTVPWGIWTFVVGRYDASVSKFSIWAGQLGRGMVKVAEQTTSSTPSTAVGPLDLGGRFEHGTGGRGSLAGSLAHFQVRTGALSDSAIQALHKAGGVPSLPDASVTFYAPLNDGSGNSALDLISGARGRIWGARWAPRMVLDFRSGHSRSKFKAKRLRPAWNAIVHWGRNFAPLSDADLAATVTAIEKAKLKRETRRHHTPSSDLKGKYLDAREITAESPLVELADARQTSRNLRYRFDPARIQGALSEAPRPTLALGMGDEVWVFHPRIRGSEGAALRVVGISPSLRSLRSALDLWGDRLPFLGAGILVDEFNPLLTDDGDPFVTD
jgi:hypothetical protein